MRHTTYNVTSYLHPCAMSLTFNVGLSHIDMHAHNMVCCCMNASMEVFYYEVQIGKLIHGMTKSPNYKKNMIDSCFFYVIYSLLCLFKNARQHFFSPPFFIFLFNVKHTKKHKIPWRQYYELYGKNPPCICQVYNVTQCVQMIPELVHY